MVRLDRLIEGPYRRKSGEDVTSLATSMAATDQLQAMVVCERGDKYEVVAGHRRWRAAQKLGRQTIRVYVLHDPQKAALACLDENLERVALSRTERAEAVSQRKALYQKLHPETRPGGRRSKSHDAILTSPERAEPFAHVEARATGKSPATVSRLARIGESATPAVKGAWDAREITEAAAAKLARLPAPEQDAELARLAASRSAAANDRPTADPASAGAGNHPQTAATQDVPTCEGAAYSPAAECEESLCRLAIRAIDLWCMSVLAGGGTEDSLKTISKGREFLDKMSNTLLSRLRANSAATTVTNRTESF